MRTGYLVQLCFRFFTTLDRCQIFLVYCMVPSMQSLHPTMTLVQRKQNYHQKISPQPMLLSFCTKNMLKLTINNQHRLFDEQQHNNNFIQRNILQHYFLLLLFSFFILLYFLDYFHNEIEVLEEHKPRQSQMPWLYSQNTQSWSNTVQETLYAHVIQIVTKLNHALYLQKTRNLFVTFT